MSPHAPLDPLTALLTHTTTRTQRKDQWDPVSVENMRFVDTQVAKNVVSVSPSALSVYADAHTSLHYSLQAV